MLSATVAQNATTPVNDGTKNRKNSLNVWNLDGVANIGPNPPALPRAHSRSATPINSRNGAVIPCRNRIVLIPRTITTRFSNQKNTKQAGTPQLMFLAAG